MHNGIYLGFDFGFKKIGVAVGQGLTQSARPLAHVVANNGLPQWGEIAKLIKEWRPQALIVGLPTTIEGKALYTTKAAKTFASELKKQFHLPVYLVDERLSTKEARAHLFSTGGYQALKRGHIDSVAACVILEQWLQHPDDAHETPA